MTISRQDALSHAQDAERGNFRSIGTLLRNLINGNINSKLAVEGGSGIVGIAQSYATRVTREGGLIKTEILIDLTGLNSSATGDIIGDDAAANCHLGQITTKRNGSLVAGAVTCLEAPATGDTDIDLYSAVEATGTEDAAVTGLTETALLASGGAWTSGRKLGLTALPANGEYLYLAAGGAGADATYTAGKLLIELWGTPPAV